MKIMKIIEFHMKVTKLMKFSLLIHEDYENLRFPHNNQETNENQTMQCENYENHENHKIP